MNERDARAILKEAVSKSRKTKVESGRRKLHKAVKPMGRVYKTKGAKGWDVMVDAMLGDTSATGASK